MGTSNVRFCLFVVGSFAPLLLLNASAQVQQELSRRFEGYLADNSSKCTIVTLGANNAA